MEEEQTEKIAEGSVEVEGNEEEKEE